LGFPSPSYGTVRSTRARISLGHPRAAPNA
jgi:hypothetical protein